jgi:hypothetical protein
MNHWQLLITISEGGRKWQKELGFMHSSVGTIVWSFDEIFMET